MKIGFKGGILSYRVGLKGLSWVARISVNLCEMADRQTVTGLSLSLAGSTLAQNSKTYMPL